MSTALADKDIREIVFTYFENNCEKLRIIEEKTIDKCRCDFLIITPDSICGFEIKSDRDSYTRLARQVKAYDRFFDYNYCIVGESHKKGVFEKLPEHWGVIMVTNGGEVSLLRRPQPRKKSLLKKQLSFLWRSELANILRRNKLPKYAQKSKKFIIGRLMEKLDEKRLKEELCEELFERDYTLFDYEE